MHPLDNPMYSALSTVHSPFAVVNKTARRFPAEVAPFGGVLPGHEDDVHDLYSAAESAVFVGVIPPTRGWEVQKSFEVIQMIHDQSHPVTEHLQVQILTTDDVPAMLKLTSLVYPNYFRSATAQLGEYCGIYSSSELIAMAGIRMKLPGYEEISAICTHLDHRGKGLGAAVTRFMVHRILQRESIPFLHTESDNPAQDMYRKLGFETRATLPVAVLKRT